MVGVVPFKIIAASKLPLVFLFILLVCNLVRRAQGGLVAYSQETAGFGAATKRTHWTHTFIQRSSHLNNRQWKTEGLREREWGRERKNRAHQVKNSKIYIAFEKSRQMAKTSEWKTMRVKAWCKNVPMLGLGCGAGAFLEGTDGTGGGGGGGLLGGRMGFGGGV